MSSATPKACGFQDELLSGLLDGMLSQGQRQRALLHLEECRECARELEEMRLLREAAMSTEFPLPADDQWDETPRSGLSRLLRNVGWATLLVWFLAVLFVVLVQPEWPERLTELLLIGGAVGGFGVLFLSAGLDRMRSARGDVYRGVQK